MEPREIRLVRQAQKGKREALETLFLTATGVYGIISPYSRHSAAEWPSIP